MNAYKVATFDKTREKVIKTSGVIYAKNPSDALKKYKKEIALSMSKMTTKRKKELKFVVFNAR